MNYPVKRSLEVLSITYMISILFPSMVIAANDKKDKHYMCYGWQSYQNKQMDLFDKFVWAEDEK